MTRGWKEYKLGEIADVQNGYAFKSTDFSDSGTPILKIKNIVPPTVTLNEVAYYSPSIDKRLEKFIIKKKDFLISMTGSTVNQMASAVGKMGRYPFDEPALINQRIGKIYATDKNVSNDYLYYYLNRFNIQFDLASTASGSANQANISPDQIKAIKITLPDLFIQTAIVEILSSLDDKIELNHQINRELEALAQALFKHWFIDFEFPISAGEASSMGKPNLAGQPYKSSGGEMVDSELGEIPKGWLVSKLNEVANCFDNKRVPLSSMERAKKKGSYPYYGAASLMDYVDDYIFDGIYLLMGEDGSVTDINGFPVLQYVSGKFWANNHAHVIQGSKVSTEIILCLLKNTNISHLVTGAVQPKLNQGNMNKISIAIPHDISQLKNLELSLNSLFEQVRENSAENIELSNLRDLILPKLISGELEVSESLTEKAM